MNGVCLRQEVTVINSKSFCFFVCFHQLKIKGDSRP